MWSGPWMTLDDEDIEAIADRVIRKLRRPIEGLVGVEDAARALGMSRAWVYRNADKLGAQRLGPGRKPALRFDLALTIERHAAWAQIREDPWLGHPRDGLAAPATDRCRR
jgi:hypothetical protein